MFCHVCLSVHPSIYLSAEAEVSSDVALYSGLGGGAVAVVMLIVIVTLYRRSHSECGVDAIDASVLTGGFQSFTFKSNTQGETMILFIDDLIDWLIII